MKGVNVLDCKAPESVLFDLSGAGGNDSSVSVAHLSVAGASGKTLWASTGIYQTEFRNVNITNSDFTVVMQASRYGNLLANGWNVSDVLTEQFFSFKVSDYAGKTVLDRFVAKRIGVQHVPTLNYFLAGGWDVVLSNFHAESIHFGAESLISSQNLLVVDSTFTLLQGTSLFQSVILLLERDLFQTIQTYGPVSTGNSLSIQDISITVSAFTSFFQGKVFQDEITVHRLSMDNVGCTHFLEMLECGFTNISISDVNITETTIGLEPNSNQPSLVFCILKQPEVNLKISGIRMQNSHREYVDLNGWFVSQRESSIDQFLLVSAKCLHNHNRFYFRRCSLWGPAQSL